MAPLIAMLIKAGLTGIAGAVASKGKELVQEKLGVNLDDALGTENGRMRLRQLELEHEEFLVDSALQADAMNLADLANARDSNVKIQESPNAGWLAKNTIYVIAYVVLGGGGYMLYYSTDADVRMAAVSAITMVLGFFFGSSKGSQSKDGVISRLVEDAK